MLSEEQESILRRVLERVENSRHDKALLNGWHKRLEQISGKGAPTNLLEAIAQQNPYPTFLQTVSPHRVAVEEKRLGLRLPDFLRALYTNIGNGGFGPGYGGISSIERVVGEFLDSRHHVPSPQHYSSEGLVFLTYWGNNISAVMDIREADCPVYTYNPELTSATFSWQQAKVMESPALHGWFEMWLNGDFET